ncbi:molybdopterin-dependent oxidoreductase [Planctomycetaceae bacterium]|jgi:DMSO/TMAO reductase YedYZ molybdopterin-dependent catalytic subunit|nr:molybdopterin-dependent oxidoreductase [Planctomycetaceae bacterium]
MTTLLTIDGLVASPQAWTLQDLQSLPQEIQVPDVTEKIPDRKGAGLTLQGILDLVQPTIGDFWITFHASHDDFASSIPADPTVIETGIVIYALDGAALPVEKGGPTRFVIPNPAACQTEELDECANVKFLDRIEITSERGRDTRPTNDEEHAALHDDDH